MVLSRKKFSSPYQVSIIIRGMVTMDRIVDRATHLEAKTELAPYLSANITVLAAAGMAVSTTQILSRSLSTPIGFSITMVN